MAIQKLYAGVKLRETRSRLGLISTQRNESTNMTTSKEIRTAIRVLEEFKKVDPELTLPAMLTFLYAVERDGQSGNQDAITQRLSMSGATASRSIYRWLDFQRPRVAGLNMLDSVPDPEDRRYKMITLNRRGMDFASKIEEAVNGTSQGK